jgi:hypothetical protein
MIETTVSIDARALEKVLSRLSHAATVKVIYSGLTKSAREAKSLVTEALYNTYNLKKKDLKSYSRTKLPSRGDLSNPESSVTVLGGAIPISRFNPKQTRVGVGVKVMRNRGREVIPSAFLAPLKGRVQPAIRTRKIKGAARKYVVSPSMRAPFRPEGGGELPINRFMADPPSMVIASVVDRISTKAADEGAKTMYELIEQLLETGRG